LPIFYVPAEKLVNQAAITPIYGGLDCPQNEHYETTARNRGYEKVFADQMDHCKA
jgi:hypothetical protein